jgi:hypothetical protein
MVLDEMYGGFSGQKYRRVDLNKKKEEISGIYPTLTY